MGATVLRNPVVVALIRILVVLMLIGVCGAAVAVPEAPPADGGAGVQTSDAELRQQAAQAFQEGRYEDFKALQAQRLAEAERSGDARLAADAQMQLGVLDRRQGRFDAARAAFAEAIETFHRLGDRNGEGQALTHQGLVLLNQGQYPQALEALEDAKALAVAGADVELDRVLQYLGLLYHGLREFDQARDFLERGLEEARKQADPQRTAPLLGSLARLANDSGNFEAALDYSRLSMELAESANSTPGRIFSLLERGRALLGLGRLDEARTALEECRELSRSIAQARSVADATFVLGRVAQQEGDIGTALRLYREAIPAYEGANDTRQTLDAYRRMVPLLRQHGESDEAARLAEAAMALQEQIGGQDVARRLALSEYRHQVADDARRIELLQRTNEVQQLNLDNQLRIRNIGRTVIVALLLVALLLAWAFRRAHRSAAALATSNASLQLSRRALLRANAELERRTDALQAEANTDELTGLPNRRHVLERLDDALALVEADNRQLALLVLDLDHFKQINDSHGHPVGDRVLQRAASVMQAQVPPGARLGRFGGEEFLLVLPGHDHERALRVAEALRDALERDSSDDLPRITVSIGVASHVAEIGVDGSRLIEAADRALYRAKQAGRNRVEAA